MAASIFCGLFLGATVWALYWFVKLLKAEDALSEQRRYSWRMQDIAEQKEAALQRELENAQQELRQQRLRYQSAWKESPQGQQWLSRQKKTRLDVN
jgi:hypothetical protein